MAARQRKPGGGQKGKLIEMSQKLFFILTVAGSVHDYSRFKEEFSLPEGAGTDAPAAWFEDFVLWVDSGCQGIQKAYAAKDIQIPHKKPRKSKADPNPSFNVINLRLNKRLIY